MAFFKDFSVALKDKWLQYYQANREWLVLQMDLNSIPTPDGGRRPASSLILGTINALDPEAAQLMLPFSKLNPDPEKLIDVLGLNFDPDLALGVRSTPEQPAKVVLTTSPAPTPVPPVVTLRPEPEKIGKDFDQDQFEGLDDLDLEEEVTPAQKLNVPGAVVAVAGAAAVVGGAAVIAEAVDEFDDLEDLGLDIDTETADVDEDGFDLGLDDESEDLGIDDLDTGLESCGNCGGR